METGIPYGQTSMKLRIDESRLLGTVAPKNTPPDLDSVSRSLSEPTGSVDLNSFLRGREKILVVVNDHTRATPTAAVLKYLQLRGKDVVTIIGTGIHRSPSSQELSTLLGSVAPPYGGQVIVHDSRDESSLRPLGETSGGTKLLMNVRLFDADGIVVIGSVEPHYFAGFTGGRKFFVPALAGRKSIEMNHSLALDPNARILALEGNPVHEDLMEALHLFNRNEDIFSIQLVLNSRQQISYTSAGNIVDSFRAAVEHAKENYTASVKAKADIVIAIARPPMDLDLYQSQKAIENVKFALKNDGVLILVSRCPDGVGNRDFYDLLSAGSEAIRKARESKILGCHKAVKLAEFLDRAHVFAITDLPRKLLEAISIKPFTSVQRALEEATRFKGKESTILIVDDAGVTVPIAEHA
jgi:nickel-dependent lactate racemase